MEFVAGTLRWQQRTLAGVLVLAALAFHRGTFDVFNTTKATIVVLGAVAIVAIGALRVARTRRAVLPVTRMWWAIGAFVVTLVIATLTSPTPLWSVVGRPGRHTGLAMYVVYAVLFAVAVRIYREESPAHLVKALLVTAVPVALYGLGQAVGLEPFGWNTIEGGPQVFATFGNANFFSAWLGIVTPLAVWAVLAQTLSVGWRLTGAVVAFLTVMGGVVSASLQGPAAAVAGTLLVGGVWLFTAGGAVRRRRRALLAAGLGVAGVLVAALATAPGVFAAVRQGAQDSLASRLPKWEAALAMARDRPLLGVGLDNYANWYPTYRSDAIAARDGLERTVDSAHNVPLDMLTSGGFPLLAAYVAVVAVTGWALVAGLRRLEAPQRLLLAGFGGAWLSYQVQSFVSIDVPPLAVLHWVLAGVVIALGAAPPLREWALPGAPALPKGRPGRKAKARAASVPLTRAHPAVLGALGVAVIVASWLATVPLRADAAAHEGVVHAAAGDIRRATTSYERAGAIAPWEPRYPAMLGNTFSKLGRSERAFDLFVEAARRDPRGVTNALNAARVAVDLNRPEEATRWYTRALRIDPTTPEILVEVGAHRLQQGDVAGARQAFERALEVDPDTPEAAEELDRLALRTPPPTRPRAGGEVG